MLTYSYRNSLTYEIFTTLQDVGRKSELRRRITRSVRMCVAWSPQHNGNRLLHDHPAAMCYRPTVFFRHFRLIEPSFLQGNFQRAFQNFNYFFFKVCKSVHHRTIQINHQPDATVFQFITLTFIYSSTGFGRFPAHHQELSDCSSSLWFYLRIVVIVVLPDHEHSTTITTIRR